MNFLQFISSIDARPLPPVVGDMVYFWTGRGSHGYAVIRAIEEDRYLLDPEPDAVRGSDYRRRKEPARDRWHPRDRGIPLSQIDTPPEIWYKSF